MPYWALNAVRIYYARAGSGVPVLLLHQYFGTHESWLALFDLLRRHFDVIAPDLRAHGRTSDPGGRLTLPGFTEDIAELARALEIGSAHLVGASLGAMVAARLAVTRAIEARSLALIGAPNFAAPSTTEYTRSMIEEIFPANEEEYGHLHRAHGPHHARERLLHTFAQDSIDRPREMQTWYEGLEGLDCPILLMAGDNDPVSPASWVVELASRLGHGEVCLLPRAGHFPHRSVPHLAGGVLLDFLLRAEREAAP
ncbi:alpha/beta fold hydrolase [Thermomicrobium sp. 4228-Ro]|uniref:alpha/beta fold hydrolase n=1 Tax=Thermomicrobium sp. 4228-Ro TaxID=2993937 RepID=UPI002248C91C|nr:alpha/beta fold hydrolase [Thermomicrobium sp. 4228-Ro]MCX2726516.1 alpha/beta fold hydrolase [Thermomicrobium sp. 4228-Ro]